MFDDIPLLVARFVEGWDPLAGWVGRMTGTILHPIRNALKASLSQAVSARW
jgi:hypothetical protein